MKKGTYCFIHYYTIERDKYGHFRVEWRKRAVCHSRLELLKHVLRLFESRNLYFYEITKNPEPKFPLKPLK